MLALPELEADGHLELTMREPFASRKAENGSPARAPPKFVIRTSAPGFSSGLFFALSITTSLTGTKYLSKTDLMSARSKKASSRTHQGHQDAPKWTKMAFCSATALALASVNTLSADGGSAMAVGDANDNTTRKNACKFMGGSLRPHGIKIKSHPGRPLFRLGI